MILRIHRVAAYLLILQGIAYTVAAGVVFDGRLSLDALRFAGTGLGWVFLALLNLSALASPTRAAMRLTVGANTVGLLYFVLLAVVTPGFVSLIAALVVLGCLAGSAMAVPPLEMSDRGARHEPPPE
jgi:hypothetical protein